MVFSLLILRSRAFHTSARINEARGPLRMDAWWIRDYIPKRAPITPKEHKEAAVRYGLRLEDYKPYDPDDCQQGVGDYPDLSITTYAHRDPHEAYTDSRYRRNWGELVPYHWEFYRYDRITFTGLEYEDMAFSRVLFEVGRIVLIFAAFFYLCTTTIPSLKLTWRTPHMPKQYPYDFYRAWPWNDARKFPIVNYTFEPEDTVQEED